ncbi:MAG TPA: response regulator [Methylomirabilota bacterium]|jgi:DNA-binding response OmpR family regulator|nr:response regulator [Methylomirabilota bacterium]
MAQVIKFPSREERAARTATAKPLRKLTILLAEDHSSLRDIVGVYLMRQGYHVRTAGSGQNALDILAAEDVDLLLLDLMLPGMDGFEVLRRIREQRSDRLPYVVVVSALTTEADRKKAKELGCDDYLPKPFHLPHLLERVVAIEKRLQRRERRQN